MRIQIFCSSGSYCALTSAFRRWLSHVFSDILFPLLAELEIVTESRSVVPCIMVSSSL